MADRRQDSRHCGPGGYRPGVRADAEYRQHSGRPDHDYRGEAIVQRIARVTPGWLPIPSADISSGTVSPVTEFAGNRILIWTRPATDPGTAVADRPSRD